MSGIKWVYEWDSPYKQVDEVGQRPLYQSYGTHWSSSFLLFMSVLLWVCAQVFVGKFSNI